MQGSSVAAATAKIVRVGVLSSISKLDPREAVDSITGMVLDQIFEAPYAVAVGDAQVKPQLFEPLRTEGRLQFSAGIVPGVRFSDGTPLTADLAVRSLRGATALLNKATVEAKGDRVWFTLASPNPRFDLTLTQSNTAIVLDRGTQLHGTGAFMFEQRPNLRLLQTAKSIRLIRNVHHAGKSGVDEAIFRVLPADEDGTPRALVDALRSGEVDLTTAVSMADVSAGQIAGVAPSPQPGNSTGVLVFNCERRILASAQVRRGIMLALDLHDLAARSFEKNPAAFLAPSLLPPMMGRASGLPATDRTEARRLLDTSGAKPGRLTLLVPWAPRPYMPKPLPLATGVQKQLAEIGIAVELRETKTSDEYFGDLVRGNYDLALTGWIADTPDPADFFEALLWSKMTEGDHPSNNSRWKNAAMDAALATFRTDPSDEHKREIHRIVREEAPLVPLIYGQSVVVHSRKMRNVSVSATGVLTLSAVTVG
ncbi:MAG TPA: ABC transporter substrate-binding protein [Thermoanaerobaculia bacterium]|jgi:peptide/nickel transport system substrate-binding protein|nr:ABC transporter substrate-binding protein [Thermoanaerobaculia bacterium]